MMLGTRRRESGFTIVELLVVLAIITIIAAVGLTNTRPISRHAQLLGDANAIVTTLREAREHAIATAAHPTKTPIVYPNYGVSFVRNTNTIQEYADCVPDDNNSGTVENTDTFRFSSANCGGSSNAVIRTIPLRASRVQSIRYDSITGLSGNPIHLSVLYLRPEPTVWFATQGAGVPNTILTSSGTITEPGTATIRLVSLDNTETITVTINSMGLAVIE